MCQIAYTATDELNSFRFSTSTALTMGRNGQNKCRNDYVFIPRVSKMLGGTSSWNLLSSLHLLNVYHVR